MVKKTKRLVLSLLTIIIIVAIILNTRNWINNPSTSFLIDPICHFETNKKEVVLSFDDGPGPATPAVLAALRKHEVKAMFFVNGNKLEKYSDIAKQSIQEGHLLANHSYQHESMIFKRFEYIENDLLKTDSLIQLAGQKNINYYRPPFGKSFINLPRVLKKHNKQMYNWSIASPAQYAATYSRENIVNQTVSQLHPGGIILLHDGWENVKPEVLTDAVEHVIKAVRAKGYKFVLPKEAK